MTYKPWIVELEITHRCNLMCKHCYLQPQKKKDMPFLFIKKLLPFLKKLGTQDIILTGGEPLLYPKLKEVIQELKKYQFRVTLQTNGTLLNSSLIPKFLENVDRIQVSFDYGKGKVRPKINIEAIRKLSKLTYVYLFVTLHRNNYPYFNTMLKIAHKNDLPIGFNVFIPIGRGKEVKDISFKKEEFLEVLKHLMQAYQNKKILRPSCPLTSLLRKIPSKLLSTSSIKGGCIAGVTALSITPQGNVLPCPFLRISAGNLYHENLYNIWNKSKLLILLRNRKKFKGKCKNCEYLSICGGCRSRAYYLAGDLLGEDPWCFKDLILNRCQQ
ncbi:MAG: radical SAM protein [Candidatus Aenigmatarchaeota archaeon]